jgi:hypothetical protein
MDNCNLSSTLDSVLVVFIISSSDPLFRYEAVHMLEILSFTLAATSDCSVIELAMLINIELIKQ